MLFVWRIHVCCTQAGKQLCVLYAHIAGTAWGFVVPCSWSQILVVHGFLLYLPASVHSTLALHSGHKVYMRMMTYSCDLQISAVAVLCAGRD